MKRFVYILKLLSLFLVSPGKLADYINNAESVEDFDRLVMEVH